MFAAAARLQTMNPRAIIRALGLPEVRKHHIIDNQWSALEPHIGHTVDTMVYNLKIVVEHLSMDYDHDLDLIGIMDESPIVPGQELMRCSRTGNMWPANITLFV